jgi:DNA-binding GntR family transcriptional regulator
VAPLADPTYSRVREKLREDIVTGYFSAGTRLKIAELVNRYGVSQMPIREALQQLQGEGLIIIEPNKGAHVRQIDQNFLENMYDIRQLIEVYLTVKSLGNFQAKDIKELETLHSKYVKAVGKSEFQQCLNLNKQFHNLIYRLADNPEGQLILEKHWQLINTMRLTFGYTNDRIQKVILEHQDIIDAIKENNPIALEIAAKKHCLNAKIDLIRRK